MKPHYRVVRYSPAPEFVEPVNVALLLVDEHARLLRDDRFPKLECVSGETDVGLLSFWLEEIEEEIRRSNPEDAHLVLTGRTSQIALGDPREIVGGISDDVEQMLIDSYLRKSRRVRAAESQRQYIDTLLDVLLKEKVHVSPKPFLKRATPQQFLSDEARKRLQSNGFTISRVLNAPHGLVLLDGLNLGASEAAAGNRAQEIGYAFDAMESVRKYLREAESKDLLRASVIFHGERMEANPRLGYAVRSLKRDSDLVIDPRNAGDEKQLAGKLSELARGELI
ncbi:MAG: hypothetical protein P4M10_07540 [Verrucomicrobiae bacterium]|nr:hypothetical protein [Verrucomicrobiae bacterium]